MAKKNLFKWVKDNKHDLLSRLTVAIGPQDETIRRAAREVRAKSPIKAHPEAHSTELDDTGRQRFIYTRPARHLGNV